MKPIISPSILSADFGYLARDIEMINRSEAEWVHIDIMDGVFVPNISFGFPVLKYVAKIPAKMTRMYRFASVRIFSGVFSHRSSWRENATVGTVRIMEITTVKSSESATQ